MSQKKVKAILQCIRSSILKISYYKLVLENSMTTKIGTRRPVPSTDQALPSCFYFRIS